jgi:hypothetical protein
LAEGNVAISVAISGVGGGASAWSAPVVGAPQIDALQIAASPVDARPVDARHVDARHVDVRHVDVRRVDVRRVDARPGDARPVSNGCFMAGTLIDIEGGAMDVARLRVGDWVTTLSGARCLARISVRAVEHSSVVRVKPGALANQLPAQEMILAVDQQVMVQDLVLTSAVMVGCGVLVNAGSIQREILAGRADWYALEFDEHEMVLSDGLALSAWRDPGQPASLRVLPPGPALFALRARLAARVASVLAGTAAEMPPDLPVPEPARTMRVVEPVAAGVAEPGSPEPKWTEPKWTGPDPGAAPALRLVGDGQKLEANSTDGLRWRFVLPAGASWLRLASPTRLPVGQDVRRIGVAVLHMALDGVPLSLTGMAAGAGFYPAEGPPGGQWRWTDGFARLVLPVSRRPRVLEVVIANWHELL